MKRYDKKIVSGGLIAALLLTGIMISSFKDSAAVAEGGEAKGRLSVTGQGKVSTKPDMAYVMVGVTTESKTAKDAQGENGERMEKVMSALKREGIREDDIRTVNYNLSPKYRYIPLKDGGSKEELTGYVSTHQVQVTVRDVNAVGKVLDSTVSVGANLSGSVMFTLSQPKMDQARADTLSIALENAESKAGVLAKGLGITLGKPKEVSENNSSPLPVYADGYGEMKMRAAAPVQVSAGLMEVTAQVSVCYEYPLG